MGAGSITRESLQTFVHASREHMLGSRNLSRSGLLSSMTVTASSGSPRVSPQLYDTLPLTSVRQAEQQDRFPDGGELDTLVTFFRSGQDRVEASRIIAANAESIVARAANRIFAGGTPLSFLDAPLSTGETGRAGFGEAGAPLAADQAAFEQSVRTFTGESAAPKRGNFFTRLFDLGGGDADVRIIIPTGFTPISIARYGPAFMRKSVRDMGWFLRYVGYAIVAGDPSILEVNTRGLRDLLLENCSLSATNLALQEMRAASADLLRDRPEARQLAIDCFNVLLKELAVSTPSTKQRLGSSVQQGLQLPAIYALASERPQRFEMRPGLSGAEKAEIIRAAYRQVFERDIAKGYSQVPCPSEASQVVQGQLSMREFIRALGCSKEYRRQFHDGFVNSRVVELAYRHFLGRGVSSLEEFRRSFSILSDQGLYGLIDVLVNSDEYAQVFGEETVPYLRDLGEEAQESAGWGSNRKLFNFSAPFEGAPQYVTLYASYRLPFPDQHVYGGGNDPVANQYGAIFPSGTASVATRPAPYGYDSRRLLVSNGLASPGQIDSGSWRSSKPRRVGPRVVRLQQIATGGTVRPRSTGLPSTRQTESSTQSVINAVYTQILGNSGYAGERLSSDEARLENGDISLRDFVRCVARSDAFRKRYWSGLYIVKAIEVMHRRLLGRPTFGRWEIDALFDTAARKGFYGVVDALINSQDYADCFGEDTVPYERFITPGDLNSRRAPGWGEPLNLSSVVESTPVSRPESQTSTTLRTSGDLTPRNLRSGATISWTPTSGASASDPVEEALELVKPGTGDTSSKRPFWSPKLSFKGAAAPEVPGERLTRALKSQDPAGFASRIGRPSFIELKPPFSEDELVAVIDETYRQLLNRIPLTDERLDIAESQLRNQDINLAQFIEAVALSEIFQNRLSRLAPLRAASAATLALLGRAATTSEISSFLKDRAEQGQPQAIRNLMARRDPADDDRLLQIQFTSAEGNMPFSSFRRETSDSIPAPIALATGPQLDPWIQDRSTPASTRWSATVQGSIAQLKTGSPADATNPNDKLKRALQSQDASGFSRRNGLPTALVLTAPFSDEELSVSIKATYRQLLNRIPLDNERLVSAEAKLRNQDIDLAGFVASVAMSDLFQARLSSMAPLRAASAAGLALLGRAASSAEVANFLRDRAENGQPQAVQNMLDLRDITSSDDVPRIEGMQTSPGQFQDTVTRTASLYRGNAGLNPPTDQAI